MRIIFSVLIIFPIFIVGVVGLQIFLSRRQNKWLGLILPLICLSFSILIVLGNTVFYSNTSTEQSVIENGVVINKVIKQTTGTFEIQPSAIITILISFILYNIPTVIFLAIYYACREKLKRKKELEKMNIQDLE